MKKIPLTQGKFALVDDADYKELAKYKWSYLNGYAVRTIVVYMHREIAGLQNGDRKVSDHINGNRLDNRNENLRICGVDENLRNRKKPNINGHKYKGIRLIGKRWRAIINHARKTYHLGMYDTPEEAARAYDAAAKRLFGDYARLNFADALRDIYQTVKSTGVEE